MNSNKGLEDSTTKNFKYLTAKFLNNLNYKTKEEYDCKKIVQKLKFLIKNAFYALDEFLNMDKGRIRVIEKRQPQISMAK